MASGLQAWDAGGRMVADLTDYNMKYMGSTVVRIGSADVRVNWPGMQSTGWLVAYGTGLYWNYYYCACYDGYFIMRYLPTSGHTAENITCEVYKYI